MNLIDYIDQDPSVRFRARPRPISPENRLSWRLAHVLLILELAGRGNQRTASFKRLHVLSWGSRFSKTHGYLMDCLTGKTPLGVPFVGVDPVLNAAVDFGIAEQFIVRTKNSRLCLTATGRSAAAEVLGLDVLADERTRLVALKQLANEGNIASLLSRSSR